MVLRSFFKILLFIFFSIFFSNHLFAKDPMSAIDWLADKINDPPSFYTSPMENIEILNNEIEKINIPNISKNSIGIFPSIRLGINVDIWKRNDEIEISDELNKIEISNLFFLNRFFKRLLLIEADPPKIVENNEFSGSFFLRARILQLIKIGALDDAEALLLSANPKIDKNLIKLWENIAFLTYRFDGFCETILNGYNFVIHPAHKIICLARSGDWNAAALTLATYSSINKIEGDIEKLLINYLDHEAELEITEKDLCTKDNPTLIYLCTFSKEKINYKQLDIKYLYTNLNRSKSIRSRLSASEELVRSGALNPNILFSTYKVKQPSTSGGVWARAKLIQDLEKKLEEDLSNDLELFNQLKLVIDEFLNQNLLTPFAMLYSKRLNEIKVNYYPLNELIIIINILSGNYKYKISKNNITNSKLQNIVDVIYKRDKLILDPRIHKKQTERILFKENAEYTELQNAILNASSGIFPNSEIFSNEMKDYLSKKLDGLVLLNSINLISSNLNLDISRVQLGLLSLVKLGLMNDFKAISNELLIMEYLKKL